jgi:lysophospholipase L1-like esterase
MLTVIVHTALNNRVIRVACVGNSITELSNYTTDLQTMLGTKFLIGNFGVSGATVLSHTYTPYIDEEAFTNAKEFQPDIVVIMLGTNDARTDSYQSIENFVENYKNLITELQQISSKPKIFLVKPPPIFPNDLDLNPESFRDGVIPRIEQVANELGLTVIDVYSALENRSDCFVDGVHPSAEGGTIIAETVYGVLNSET